MSTSAETLACRAVRLIRKTPGGGERTVLDGVEASFEPGAPALVRGPTGSGKTTLLAIVSGIMRPTEGIVTCGDEPVSRWTAGHRDAWRRQVGIVFQSPHLVAGLTALENVMLPLVPRISIGGLRRRAGEALSALEVNRLAGEDISRLSGGERQRVTIARALIGDPRILIADEPTAHQDEDGVDVVGRILENAADGGAVVVVASHDPRLERRLGSAVTWTLEHGRLGRSG